MSDYNLFRALEVCMKDARKQAIDGGVETGILVASAANISQEGPKEKMTDKVSIERMAPWGEPNESKLDFVMKYVRNYRDTKDATPMAWDAEIEVGTVNYMPDSNRDGYIIAFGVLTDTTENGKDILKNALETFHAVKV